MRFDTNVPLVDVHGSAVDLILIVNVDDEILLKLKSILQA